MLHVIALELGVKIKFGIKVDVIDQALPSIILADGEIFTPDLIIGADGQLQLQLLAKRPNIHQVPDPKSEQQS